MNPLLSTGLQEDFALCICTYQRPQLVNQLITDVLSQYLIPEVLVVVDGDSETNDVLDVLQNIVFPKDMTVVFIPSNHANLSYQRYLGWIAAMRLQVSFLLYLDDDLRISQQSVIERIFAYFNKFPDSVGLTTVIEMGEKDELFNAHPILIETKSSQGIFRFFVDRFGSGKNIAPGSLTPSGHRVMPVPVDGKTYSEVEWLRGGVMLYRMSALRKECFSVDLFALDHIRCGKGEDTYLSRQVMTRGRLLYAHDITIQHPNADLPKTYPVSAYKLAFATAYSRRFLNDHYRPFQSPMLSDRFALLKSYLGNSLLAWGKAFSQFKKHHFAYALGYTLGALRGVLQKPTAKNLTPDIDWWEDAELALEKQVQIQ